MGLDEAIKHLDELLKDEKKWKGCKACKQEHMQLKEWLSELKDIKAFLTGEWIESDRIQNILQMNFSECFSRFEFSRTAEWWSIVGTTDEERQREGQKVTTCFRLRLNGGSDDENG